MLSRWNKNRRMRFYLVCFIVLFDLTTRIGEKFLRFFFSIDFSIKRLDSYLECLKRLMYTYVGEYLKVIYMCNNF